MGSRPSGRLFYCDKVLWGTIGPRQLGYGGTKALLGRSALARPSFGSFQ
jgi:hypothetical protein